MDERFFDCSKVCYKCIYQIRKKIVSIKYTDQEVLQYVKEENVKFIRNVFNRNKKTFCNNPCWQDRKMMYNTDKENQFG